MLRSERVAQAVEHVTFNHGVAGSSPAALTNKINALDEYPSNTFSAVSALCLQDDCRAIVAGGMLCGPDLPYGHDGDEFPIAVRGMSLMIGCLGAAALLVTSATAYGLARLAMAVLG
jgi:hypothetical protein